MDNIVEVDFLGTHAGNCNELLLCKVEVLSIKAEVLGAVAVTARVDGSR